MTVPQLLMVRILNGLGDVMTSTTKVSHYHDAWGNGILCRNSSGGDHLR